MTDIKDLKEGVGQTAHKVWLAGLGAMTTAGDEGAKLFKSLVEKGKSYEARGRERFDGVKDRVEETADKAKERAETTWDKIEVKVDEAVTGALARFGVPSRDEIATLTKRVEELTAVVEQLKPAKPAPAKKATRKTAPKKAATTA